MSKKCICDGMYQVVLVAVMPFFGSFSTNRVAFAQSPRNVPQSIVIARGVGVHEGEAKSEAFLDAIAQVVGTMVERDLLVRNDEIVRDDLREHCSGFIRTYQLLESRPMSDGRVCVTIRATVDRTNVPCRIRSARTELQINPEGLFVEKSTREKARLTATKMLVNVMSDLSKLGRVEFAHRPQLTPDGKAISVPLSISVDEMAYVTWAKRAVAILDRMAITKETVIIHAERVETNLWRILEPSQRIFDIACQTSNSPTGFAIWILTDRDKGWSRTRWRYYWVEADGEECLTPLKETPTIHLQARDISGKILTEEIVSISLPDSGWFLFHPVSRCQGQLNRVLIGPIFCNLGSSETRFHIGLLSPTLHQQHFIRFNSSDVHQFANLTAFVSWDGKSVKSPVLIPQHRSNP